MPEGNKCKSESCGNEDVVTTTTRDINVLDKPLVVRSMPTLPEAAHRVVVVKAAHHVLWRIDAIGQSPNPSETPYTSKLQPHHVQTQQYRIYCKARPQFGKVATPHKRPHWEMTYA